MIAENSDVGLDRSIKLDIVTPEKLIFSDFVDYVSAPGVDGELGILPRHCPLITMLRSGELRIRKASEEILVAIGGGFLEITPERVIVLADLAERDEHIDAQKVEEAKKRAEQTLADIRLSVTDKAEAEAALRFELARLKVLEKRQKKKRV